MQRCLILEWNFHMPTFHLVMYCNYLATNTNTEFIHIVEYIASRKEGGSYNQRSERNVAFSLFQFPHTCRYPLLHFFWKLIFQQHGTDNDSSVVLLNSHVTSIWGTQLNHILFYKTKSFFYKLRIAVLSMPCRSNERASSVSSSGRFYKDEGYWLFL